MLPPPPPPPKKIDFHLSVHFYSTICRTPRSPPPLVTFLLKSFTPRCPAYGGIWLYDECRIHCGFLSNWNIPAKMNPCTQITNIFPCLSGAQVVAQKKNKSTFFVTQPLFTCTPHWTSELRIELFFSRFFLEKKT